MAVYSIKDLEKLSGIKAHTIRVWEQRYSIINPKRTKTNIRYYQDDDLKLLLNIALLNKNGIRISKIAKMSEAEISEKVSAISDINAEYGTQLDALTISMMEMDEFKFNKIITTNINQLGFERTMMEVIYPFLEKLSVLWLTGTIMPVQENFISYLIRQKIIAAIDQAPLVSSRNAKTYLLYLPEGERQELSVLFLQYLIKSRKHQAIYVGQDININDLKDAAKIIRPDFIFTMITETFAQEPVQKYIDKLSHHLPTTHILLSGYQVISQSVAPSENISILRSLDQTLRFIEGR